MILRVKELREKRKMSIVELAEKSGVSRMTISRMENHPETVTSTGTIAKLAKALEYSPASFFASND